MPPPYSMTDRPPHYAQLDSHRGPNIANSSSAGHVFAPAEFDRIFLRLQQEFARLRTETDKLQAMKNQAAEQDARDRDVPSRIRDQVILKAKVNQVERMAINSDRLQIVTDQARLAGEAAKVTSDREVVATKYETALEVEKDNRGWRLR